MMKTWLPMFLGLWLAVASTGCVTTGPAISKSKLGNLQINLLSPDDPLTECADVYLDDLFVGNVSKDMPVLYVKRGARTIRVQAPGYKPYERQITILGDPNHQVLQVQLKRE